MSSGPKTTNPQESGEAFGVLRRSLSLGGFLAAMQWGRKGFAFAFLTLAVLAFAQSMFEYTDAKGKIVLRSKTGLLTLPKENFYHFDLRGNVSVTSKNEGVTITAAQSEGDIGQAPNSKESEVQRATASGGIKLVRTASKAPGGVTTLTGSSMVYNNRGTESFVTVNGSVHITSTNPKKHQILDATGSNGDATLLSESKGKDDPLRMANLDGNVKVTVNQAAVAGKPQAHIVATGRHLNVDNTSKPMKLTLTGGVKMTGSQGGQFGSLSNVDKVEITVNEKGEMLDFKAGSS